MTRKQVIIFFADYRKAKALTVERDKNRILVEVNSKFYPEDMAEVSKKIKRRITPMTQGGSSFLVIYF